MSILQELPEDFAWDLLELEIELEMSQDPEILKKTINSLVMMYTVIIKNIINILSYYINEIIELNNINNLQMAVEYYEQQNSDKHQYFVKKIHKTYLHPYFQSQILQNQKMNPISKNIKKQVTLKNFKIQIKDSEDDIESRNNIVDKELQTQNDILLERLKQRKKIIQLNSKIVIQQVQIQNIANIDILDKNQQNDQKENEKSIQQNENNINNDSTLNNESENDKISKNISILNDEL